MTAYSILDLSPILRGGDAAQALGNSLDLARHAEQWGYTRYWVAEHHNMPGVASAATSVVIGHIAAGTHRIRVGSGGVMLPNHAPLVIAEQFGTLAALHPGRIDLGLGRAPGTDMETARALRRDLNSNAMEFPRDVEELQAEIMKGGDIESLTQGFRETPLHRAAFGGASDCITALLHAKADINAMRSGGFTALHLAETAEVARILIDYGADKEAKATNGKTPLQDCAGGAEVQNFIVGYSGSAPAAVTEQPDA